MIRATTVLLAIGFAFLSSPTDARQPRSRAVLIEFQQLRPCPSTGKPRGPCPGWEKDHIIPLGCGGADHPDNLQWLTVAEHKAKTKRDWGMCLHDYLRK